jgi:hypothetical protein
MFSLLFLFLPGAARCDADVAPPPDGGGMLLR